MCYRNAQPTGSPPQVRGKLKYGEHNWEKGRITPAGAGKTLSVILFFRCREDHPRRCGENQAKIADAANRDRITPAGAGKTCVPSSMRRTCKDHPRRCGENITAPDELGNVLGSPPQVRGKLQIHRRTQPQTRITPAGARKTRARDRQSRQCQDHPRRCGENQRRFRSFRYTTGSPPQVRGKHSNHTANNGNQRITPAGAGKTRRRIQPKGRTPDHPRRCGENQELNF